jgi:hypothetical protein
MSEPRHEFTAEEARRFGEEIGIDWASTPFDVDQFRIGMNVELEHGLHDPHTNVSDDTPTSQPRSRSHTSTSSRTTTRDWNGWRKKPSGTGNNASNRWSRPASS